MNFLKRAIRSGIRQGISSAVSQTVRQAIEPKATELANRAEGQIDAVSQNNPQPTQTMSSNLEGALSNLERAAESYATELSKNLKVCPSCGQPAKATEKFCVNCGTKLPEETVAQAAVCPSCGKQNGIGTKFCCECGTRLPIADMEAKTNEE